MDEGRRRQLETLVLVVALPLTVVALLALRLAAALAVLGASFAILAFLIVGESRRRVVAVIAVATLAAAGLLAAYQHGTSQRPQGFAAQAAEIDEQIANLQARARKIKEDAIKQAEGDPPWISFTSDELQPSRDQITRYINALREGVGAPSVTHVREIDALAQARAISISARGKLGHEGFVEVAPRVNGGRGVGEVQAYGTWFDAIRRWNESVGHRTVILDPRVDRIGVGLAVDSRGTAWINVITAFRPKP